MKKIAIALGVLVMLGCACVLPMGVMGDTHLKVGSELVLGFIPFVADTASRVRVDGFAVVSAVACLVFVTFGIHVFASWLRREMRPAATRWRLKWTISIVGLIVLTFVAGIASVGLAHQTVWLATAPEPLVFARTSVSAIGALKTIQTSEAIFREGDKDGDKVLDYGTLDELGAPAIALVDPILAGGTKQGYVFAVHPSVTSSEFLWFATAVPAQQLRDERSFFTNQSGVIYYTTASGPVPVDRSTCEVPQGWRQLGK